MLIMNILINNYLLKKYRKRGVLLRAEQGATAILLSVLMIGVLLVIGLGVSVLMANQVKMSTDAGQSVLAFYAADAGAERCLMFVRKGGGGCGSGTLSNGATFSASRPNPSTIISTGSYGSTNRRVELSL